MLAQKETLTLVVIGPKHAGKTVYLTTLANSPGVSLSDPATIDVVSLHWKTLQDGRTPPATAGTITNLAFTFQCDTEKTSYNVDFEMPDYDGHFAETLSKYEGNNDIEKLRQVIAAADGFIVFMPVGDEDTVEELRHEIGSFVGILRKVYDEDAKVPAPLIIAVNKWDKSPDFKSQNENAAALEYIKSVEIYNLLYERLNSFFANVTVLPISAYGHKTDDENPVAGALKPYRVTEPVMLVVEAFFTNLARHVTKEEESKNYTALATTLIGTEPLWKRWPGANYSDTLQNALQACYEELTAALSTASNKREFDEIWNKSPEHTLVEYFTPAQQVELQQLRAPHLEAEKKRKIKIGSIAAAVVLAAGVIWGLIDFNNKFNEAWLKASNAEAQNSYQNLNEFLNEYEGSSLARMFGSAKLETARQRVQEYVEKTQQNLDKSLAEIAEMPDSCKRQDEAAQLLELTAQLPDNIPTDSMNRLNALFKNSKEICEAKAKIETADQIDQLQEAKEMLSGKPADAEVQELRQNISEKIDRLVAENMAQEEKARIAPIREEYERVLRDEGLSKVEYFIQQHEHDENPEVKTMVSNLDNKLPYFFYTEIMKKIADLRDLTGNEFGELRTFIADNFGHISLNEQERANIRRVMQEKVERLDSEQINSIPDVINTQQQLEAVGDQLQKSIRIDAYNLDGGLFEYSRPQSLASILRSKIDKYNYYMDSINEGIPAQWAVIAQNKNAISLDCDNLIAFDAQLNISFPGGLPNKSYQETLSCRRLDGSRGYVFFYNGTVRPYNGSIRLTKDRRFGSPLSCTSNLTITVDDIIKLSNNGSIEANLQNNCPGISIQFSR